MKKKIAIIGLKGLPSYGGAASVGENIIDQLKDQYEFTVYSISSHADKRIEHNEYQQKIIKAISINKLNILYYYIASALHAIFCGKYDLIHLHHRDASFILTLLRIKYRVIVTLHGIKLTEKWAYLKVLFIIQDILFLPLANNITTVSPIKDKSLYMLFKRQIYYIPNGINKDKYNEEKIIVENNYILFAAARIVPSKGCLLFIKALKKLNYKGEVIIIGDLDQMSKHRKEILQEASGLQNVKFIGLIKNKDLLFTYIKKAKYYVFPSRIEAMSMMLLEVASMKTPIVSSDIDENKVIFNKDEVLYFKTGDVIDLSEKINWAMSNEESMKKKSERAYKKIVEKYSWSNIARKYNNIYKNNMR